MRKPYQTKSNKAEKIETFKKTHIDTIDSILSSQENFERFLQFSARFYKYEINEQIFFYAQNTQITNVATFDQWKSLDRFVKSGEKAIQAMKYLNGRVEFISVFDVSQTGGKKIVFPDYKMSNVEMQFFLQSQLGNNFRKTESEGSVQDGLIELIKQKGKFVDLSKDYGKLAIEIATRLLNAKFGLDYKLESVNMSGITNHNQTDFIKVMNRVTNTNLEIIKTAQVAKKVMKEEKEYARNDDREQSEIGTVRKNVREESSREEQRSVSIADDNGRANDESASKRESGSRNRREHTGTIDGEKSFKTEEHLSRTSEVAPPINRDGERVNDGHNSQLINSNETIRRTSPENGVGPFLYVVPDDKEPVTIDSTWTILDDSQDFDFISESYYIIDSNDQIIPEEVYLVSIPSQEMYFYKTVNAAEQQSIFEEYGEWNELDTDSNQSVIKENGYFTLIEEKEKIEAGINLQIYRDGTVEYRPVNIDLEKYKVVEGTLKPFIAANTYDELDMGQENSREAEEIIEVASNIDEQPEVLKSTQTQIVEEEEDEEEMSLFDMTVEDEDYLSHDVINSTNGETVNKNNSSENYLFPVDTTEFYPTKLREKMHGNIEAIKLSIKIENENRLANEEEKIVLAKYVGWGGLANIFDTRIDVYRDEREELQNILSTDDYKAARNSVLTAYYTDPQIIRTMYEKLTKSGFEGGKILDPSMGTGNFFSAMPREIMENSNLFGVELDPVTGRIAKLLHPKANIEIQGFEKTMFEENSFDLIISNIPFDNYRIHDPKYPFKPQIHDYFIYKSLDLVKEGGVVAVITSVGTMDKGDLSRITDKAHLRGAVRLPNNAFKKIAGTSVTTDVLFFQKETGIDREQSAVWGTTNKLEDDERVSYNNYFHNNPKQILGEIAVENFRGGVLTVKPNKEGTLIDQMNTAFENFHFEVSSVSEAKDIREISKEKVTPLPRVRIMQNIPEKETKKLQEEPREVKRINATFETTKLFSYVFDGEKLFFNDGEELIEEHLSDTQFNRVLGMLRIRDALEEVIEMQQDLHYDKNDFENKLTKLNSVYDDFIRKNGYLNDAVNKRLFLKDDSSPLLLSVEYQNEQEKKQKIYSKSEIFKRATIRPKIEITEVDTAFEALNLCLNEKLKVDLSYIQNIYPKGLDKIIEELDELIFLDPEKYEGDKYGDVWLFRDEYLTGDVKTKLSVANEKAQAYPEELRKNIESLKEVQPEDLKVNEIEFGIGATWIPLDFYKDFMFETFETRSIYREYNIIDLDFDKFTARYFISGKTKDNSVAATTTYGTKRASAYLIFENSLNLQNVEVRDKVEDGDQTKYILNPKETMLARSKQELMQEKFKSWLFQSEERSEKLLRLYNDQFNRIVPRNYDGSDLVINGMNEQFELRPHQKNVVARILYSGRALMAHEVGAGKTASMISAGMIMKDLGLIRKPLYVVPNHLTSEFGQELLRFFPSKKVLITTKKDFTKQNRKEFVSKIAVGEYDAIIIGQSQFEKIPLSIERQTEMLESEIEEVSAAITEQKHKDNDSWSIKQMIAFEKRLKERLEKLNKQDSKDKLLDFEQLGVDYLFVDEAHVYKNLYSYTKLSNVAGVNSSNSMRASDMQNKCHYMLSENKNRGVTFATGTPISNSMSEMYTMQKFLQPDVLASYGLSVFDNWASTFGEVVSSLEITPEGSGYQMKNRFSKFHNLPELMKMFNLVADIQTADMLQLPVPDIQNGKAEIIVTEPIDYQKYKMDELAERAENIRAGIVDPREDNMLKITNEAKLMSLDPRLLTDFDVDLFDIEDLKNTKVSRCAEKVFSIWLDTAENKSTQIIFSDSGTPKPNQFNIYDHLKNTLVKKGVPAEQIAFIHDAKNENQREELFDKVRSGTIRIILGSTSKIGTGTNIQDKLIAAHHIDCPWRPSDITQRDGRIVRQGNENKEVQVFRYVTKGTFDSYLWQIQEQKLTYITQVMSGKSISRSCEELSETVLTASEVKAVATGNPLLAEKMKLDNEISKLRILKGNHQSEKMNLRDLITKTLPDYISGAKERIKEYSEDIRTINSHTGTTDFSIKLANRSFSQRSDAAETIEYYFRELSKEEKFKEIGEYRGLKISMRKNILNEMDYDVLLEGRSKYRIVVAKDSAIGAIRRIENEVERIPKHLEESKERLGEHEGRLEAAEKEVVKEFEHNERLEELIEKQNEINLEIQASVDTNKNEEVQKVETIDKEFV